MTGKLQPEFFPRIFGPEQNEPLDEGAVRKAFKSLAQKLGDGRTPEEIADGFIRIAVENMANAIKTISVQRGYDVTEYVLNSFGGAGGQHACLVADALGIKAVLIHPLSGVLSAFGMGLASLSATRTLSVLKRLDEEGLGRGRQDRARRSNDEVRQELMRKASSSGDIAVARASASPLCRHRQRAAHSAGEPARHARSVRDRASAAVRVHQPGEGHRDRGDRESRPTAAARRSRSLMLRAETTRPPRLTRRRGIFTKGAGTTRRSICAPTLRRAIPSKARR